ncbi:MAG: hypothetical protein J5562_07530 [Clostridia bacterium]|nr:hypothetical protein [Clostridia bacterium]
MKKAVSVLLSLLLILSVFSAFSFTANATKYKTGDIIEFGSYPQTDVTDSLGNILNTQSGNWKSFNYNHYGIGAKDYSDYMRYIDVFYNGTKYRGIIFDEYRVNPIFFPNGIPQEENGYSKGCTYWFKYEPLKWRVLDAKEGLVHCDSVIDSQPFNDYVVYDSEKYGNNLDSFSNDEKTIAANDYANCSLRKWLNGYFYNTAFTNEEKEDILISNVNPDAFTYLVSYDYNYLQSSDKVCLLSFEDVHNKNYGFPRDSYSSTTRKRNATEYAMCQGVELSNYNKKTAYWWLCDFDGITSDGVCFVRGEGNCDDAVESAFRPYIGVCPALRLQSLSQSNQLNLFQTIIQWFKDLFEKIFVIH